MKRKDFKAKLSLNKETISNLNPSEIANVRGGGTVEPSMDAQDTCSPTKNCPFIPKTEQPGTYSC